MKRHPQRKAAALLPAALLFTALLFCLFPHFAVAQTRTEEWIETGRFGTEEETPDTGTPEKGFNTQWLYLGLRTGPSLRFYTPANDTRYTGGDTLAVSLDVALQINVQLLSFLSIQAEALFTWDNASLWAYHGGPGSGSYDRRYTKDYTAFSFQFPLVVKYDFYPRRFRLSPFLGAYYFLPLGKLEASDSLSGNQRSLDYEVSLPFGLLGGLSGAMKFGPGTLIADIRYTTDLGEFKGRGGDIEKFKRGMVSFTMGYELGFFTKKKGGRP
jgi:hypothetical protein